MILNKMSLYIVDCYFNYSVIKQIPLTKYGTFVWYLHCYCYVENNSKFKTTILIDFIVSFSVRLHIFNMLLRSKYFFCFSHR